MQKKYLITGATSGIGLATCKKILSNGDIVYAVGRNNSKLAILVVSMMKILFISYSLI